MTPPVRSLRSHLGRIAFGLACTAAAAALQAIAPVAAVAAGPSVEAPVPPPASVAAEPLLLTRVEFLGSQYVAARMASAALGRAGRASRIVAMPAERARNLTQAGGSDGEVGRIGAYFEGRPELLRVEPPLMESEAAVFVRRGHPLQDGSPISEAAQLRGLRVGGVRGVLLFERAVAGLPSVVRVNAPTQLYRMLDAGRLDAVVDTPINMQCMARHLGRPGGFVRVGTLAREPVFLGLQARHGAVAVAAAEAWARAVDAGEAEALRREAEHDYLESECR